MNVEKINFNSKTEIKELEAFLSSFDLKYDKYIDYSVVIRQNNNIIATASKYNNIIKCFAISPDYQGEGISGIILTNIVNKMFEEGYFHSMVFTKTENKKIFEGIGYKEISHTDKVSFLEMGNKSIKKAITNIKDKFEIDVSKKRAMLVMNCNPFTLGHQFLVEQAAKENEEVLVFIVEEDKSFFPFKVRYELAKQGLSHLKNVKVIPGTEYIISSATFPSYFLKEADDAIKEYTKLDATITAEHFCKMLNINKRYLGEEPFCGVTDSYNQSIENIFPKYGLEVVIIRRRTADDITISASLVRNKLALGKLDEVENLVPKTTFNFLMSEAGKEIIERIKLSVKK